MKLQTIISALKKHKRFLISTHVNPDPDALCSEMAISIYLKSIGKKVVVLNEEKAPQRYHFLPGVKQIQSVRSCPKKLDYDAVIVVDCGDLGRIGHVQEKIIKGKTIINIDHHITNDMFGKYNLVIPKASSTAEILYELISKAKGKISKSMAIHLYTGIMTDTGSFRYENTTTRTHEIISRLMKFDLQPYELYRKLYETFPLNDLKAFTKVISSFDSRYGGKVASVKLRKSLISSFSEEFDLRDSIFKFLRSIKGVEVVVIFN